MMRREEVARWLDTLPAGALVWIDDGGSYLEANTPGERGDDLAYLEIGGEPEALPQEELGL